jgi:hypothetical protein
MIKSFHEKKPPVHTYLVLKEYPDGVVLGVADQNGCIVRGGQLMTIRSDGIALHMAVDSNLGIKLNGEIPDDEVLVLSSRGYELNTKAKWLADQ